MPLLPQLDTALGKPGQTQYMWHVYVQVPSARTLGPVLAQQCPQMVRQG